MIVYFDTSSLVKLYVEEDESDSVKVLLDSASHAAISIVGYAEARAAFARRYREKSILEKDYHSLIGSFDNDWGNYLIIQVSHELVKLAGELIEKHELRGFDALHLASAIILNQNVCVHY